MFDMRGSLFLKAFASLLAGVMALSAAYYFFSVPYIRAVTTGMEEAAARNYLEHTLQLVDRAHQDLARWRHSAMEARRRQLVDIVTLAENYVRSIQADVAAGILTEEEGRRRALGTLRRLQYGNNDYVWVADHAGVLISHPDPRIENTNTHDNPALAGIVPPIIETARWQGDGFLRYYWRRLGEERMVEKLAYFRHIPDWGWVVSTGVYIDDVESEVAARQAQLVEELRAHIAATRIAGSGYMYIFDADGRMVAHPSIRFDNQRFTAPVDPATGRSLFAMLMEAADTDAGTLRYRWDKPDDRDNYVHEKIAWVRHFAPLDWYIASSVYTDELQTSSRALSWRIGLVVLGGLLLAMVGGTAFAWAFTRPIRRLTDAARRIAAGETGVAVDTSRRDEIGTLAKAVAWMVEQLAEQVRTLEARVAERTAQLSEANAEMAAANERLRKLDKMKSDFLSSVSHELRTPLTSIRGFARLIGRDFERWFQPLASDGQLAAKGAKLRENVDIIVVESERLTRLINDVLDLAKIESGRLDWNDETVAPADVVQQAVNAVRGQFEQRPAVRLECAVENGLPPLRLDRDRLVQVLVNMLNNAAKFTERGSVTVSARRADDGGVHLSVADTGCGFPPEQAEAVFDKFRQVGHGDTLVDKPKGTGLGLAICREIVAHYGGSIWAESAVGQGSTFHLLLPPAGTAAPAAAPAERETERLDVLIVEDDPHVRSYLTQFFEGEGFAVEAASDGEAGVAAALRTRPAVVVMDLDLPRLDGASAIGILRREAADLPIVVVSGMPHPEQAGGDVTIAKPVDEARLLAAVRLLLPDPARAAPSDQTCVVVSNDGEVADVHFPSPTPTRLELCPVADLPARIAEGIVGSLVVPVDLLDGIDLAATARRVSQVIIVSSARRPKGEDKI